MKSKLMGKCYPRRKPATAIAGAAAAQDPVTPIGTIQGAGERSPRVGEEVVIEVAR